MIKILAQVQFREPLTFEVTVSEDFENYGGGLKEQTLERAIARQIDRHRFINSDDLKIVGYVETERVYD